MAKQIYIRIGKDYKVATIIRTAFPAVQLEDGTVIEGTLKRDNNGDCFLKDADDNYYRIDQFNTEGEPYIFYLNYKEELWDKETGKLVEGTIERLAYLEPVRALQDFSAFDRCFEMLGYKRFADVENSLGATVNSYCRYTQVDDTDVMTRRVTISTNAFNE